MMRSTGIPTKTRAEQRIAYLINLGRPLTDEESDELYRALHADYMRKWRQERTRRAERDLVRLTERVVEERDRCVRGTLEVAR